MAAIHLIPAELNRMMMATRFGMQRNTETILLALEAIGQEPYLLLLTPRYTDSFTIDPGSNVWVIDREVTTPKNVGLFIPPDVFVEGAATLNLLGPLITFNINWYRGTGRVLHTGEWANRTRMIMDS